MNLENSKDNKIKRTVYRMYDEGLKWKKFILAIVIYAPLTTYIEKPIDYKKTSHSFTPLQLKSKPTFKTKE